jgi:phosphate transport system protein
LVSEALAGATDALLTSDAAIATMVVAREATIDGLVEEAEGLVWRQIEESDPSPGQLRSLVRALLIVPELERSADLAEHIAQRGLTGLGREMTPLSRGIVQRMAEVGIDMWGTAASAYGDGSRRGPELDEADEEMDVLHNRLMAEVAAGPMEPSTAAQVTLVGRFYERLGDHAVNVARRIGEHETRPTTPG